MPINRSPLPPRTKRPPARNPKRRAKNLLRAHGTPERRAWMKTLPCAVCGRTPSDAAHITTGGTGRKADANQTVPLCAPFSMGGPMRAMNNGHHWELDNGPGRRAGFEKRYDIDLAAVAAHTETLWQERSAAA